MKILVTNDDGINADGLWSLVSELKEVGKVTVVAPDREQSGVGTSMSLHNPVRLAKIHEKIAGIDTYSVEGTPADCVLMAMKVIMPGGIDLLVSGINQGPNCSYDVFLSGTVGAALQGFFYDIPSIAVSMNSFEDPMFESAALIAKEVAGYIKRKKMKGKMLLNVNVPSLPLKQIRGIDVTRLGEKKYSAGVEKGFDGKHTFYWILHRSTDTPASGTDLWALEHKRVSITPLRFVRSEYNTEFVHEMAPEIAGRLIAK
ncbi:MAG: 5'/3'-nucleotidase SurE [Dehalococcoidia bacterium]